MKKIFLKNSEGQVIRTAMVEKDDGFVIFREDDQRIEMVVDTLSLTEKEIPFRTLASFSLSSLGEGELAIPGVGTISLKDGEPTENVPVLPEGKNVWQQSLGGVAVLFLIFMGSILSLSQDSPEIEEELKQHVVKIIKRNPKPIEPPKVFGARTTKEKTQPKKVKKSVKRMGALAVLGRLNKNRKNRGGLNLGQVKTSRGPGLGGTQGSGGVQTSLYGKGIIAAPLGPGANVKGAGGYGTKGKGGGQDGYGQLSLVGSVGTASIPLGKEAIIQGGLDEDVIAAVIRKNMGQITFCYEQGLQGDPKLSGRVAVRFSIGSGGSVKTAGINSSTLHSKVVEDCILMRLRTFRFPEPEGGVEVSVTSFPFLLERAGVN